MIYARRLALLVRHAWRALWGCYSRGSAREHSEERGKDMARQINTRDISPILAAAEQWIKTCLIENNSIFATSRWTRVLVDEVHHAFVDHPDAGEDDFMTKLIRQMKPASSPAQQLMAEMLWVLLLFPSNMKSTTKRRQVREIWALSGQQLAEDHPLLRDNVLVGIGSGGMGFNTFRPSELIFLVTLTRDLKSRDEHQREKILLNYDAFIDWIDSVPQKGNRQFRHMLRYFAFPDRVERISSNGDRRKILEAFNIASSRELVTWTDRQLDDALIALRAELQKTHPTPLLDFYEPGLRERWSRDRKIKTVEGEVTVTVPSDDDEPEDREAIEIEPKPPEARQSIKIQSKLAEIGAILGFKIWIPRADRGRVEESILPSMRVSLLDELPMNYNNATLATIEQIDVLWITKRGSISRAFEVEHTTAVYSGLLRMADLLALQPNMDIHLHIVAPDERRDKVFREMHRPVFTLLERGPLSKSCTFISYESIYAIADLKHLSHTHDTIIAEYEEKETEAA